MKKNEFVRKKTKLKSGFTFSVIHKIAPILIILVSLIMATQQCARQIDYNVDIIGKPFVIIKGEPFYPPYAIFLAWLVSATNINFTLGDIIYQNLKIVVNGVVIALVVYLILVYVRNAIDKEDKNLYATGRWGTKKDLKDEGLLSKKGVVIGMCYDAIIEYSMDRGLKLSVKKLSDLVIYDINYCGMLMAGTRLGKGISTVVPTHLLYPTSLISIDPKGENYAITSGWRMKWTYVYCYAPTQNDTLHYNILDDINQNFAYRDANMIADILTSPNNPASNADPHWQDTARTLITAAILHCKCSSYKNKSLPGVYRFLTGETLMQSNKDSKKDIKRVVLEKMINSKHCNKVIHSAIVSGASQINSAPDEELGSIFSSALTALSVFNDDKVAKSAENSDFTLDDFKYSLNPISWYLCIPFSDLKRLSSLCRALIEFVCKKFSQGLTTHGNEALKNRILFLIDEFPTLGKMESIEEFAGILNGYGLSFLWICQSKAQIDKLYGQNAPILEHCKYMWTYAINDNNVAEYFSKRIGNEGIIKQNTSSSGSRFDFGMNNMTISSDIGERSLMSANEIANLAPDSLLLFIQGGPTHLLKKSPYYADKRLRDKANLPHPETREQMLYETRNSRVIREGEDRWDDCDEDVEMNYMPEIDTEELYSQPNNEITENKNIEENSYSNEYAGVLV